MSCNYSVPRTVGFYQLRNTMARVSDSFNTYMFVSDANAPVPLYDVESEINWWNDESKSLEVSNSLFLYADSLLFNQIGEVKLPFDEIGKTFYKCLKGKAWKGSSDNWNSKQGITWKNVLESNLSYHYLNKSAEDELKSNSLQQLNDEGAMNMYAVFQGLRNPYQNTNIILATRKDYEDFANAKGTWKASNKKKNSGIDISGKTGYLFMMGLPCCHTGKGKRKTVDAFYKYGSSGYGTDGQYDSWRKLYEDNGNKKTKKSQLANYLANMILHEAFGVALPADMKSAPAN